LARVLPAPIGPARALREVRDGIVDGEFWFEFDNFFNPAFGEVGDDVLAAYAATGGPFAIRDSWRRHRAEGTYPDAA
jgi:hypothetical protein